ncbi:hypothetical protein ACP4OV_012556 [Aristida adscensionis]
MWSWDAGGDGGQQFGDMWTPSKVLHLQNLLGDCAEEELLELCKSFGRIVRNKGGVGLNRNQAFVEFDRCHSSNLNGFLLCIIFGACSNKRNTVYVQYSNRQGIINPAETSGKVLFVTIQGVQASDVTIDVIRMVFSAFGYVHKISTFENPAGFHAFIQYSDAATASAARDALDGRSIPSRSRDYNNLYLPISLQPAFRADGRIVEAVGNVLLASIENVQYDVGVDVLHTVFFSVGTVQKIAIFEKNGEIKALIQYPDMQQQLQLRRKPRKGIASTMVATQDYTIPAGVTLPQPAGVSAAFSGWLCNPQAAGGYAPPGIPGKSHSSNGQVPNWNPSNSGYPLAPGAYPGQVYSAPVQYTALGGFPTTPAGPPHELRAMQQMPPPHHGGQQFTPAGAPGVKMATGLMQQQLQLRRKHWKGIASTMVATAHGDKSRDNTIPAGVTLSQPAGMQQQLQLRRKHWKGIASTMVATESFPCHTLTAHGDKSRDNTIPAGVTLPQAAGVSAAFSGCLYNPQAVGGYAPPGIPGQSHSSNGQVPNWNPGNSGYPLAPEAYPGQVYSAPVQYTALGGFPTTPAVPPQELRYMQQKPPPHHGGQQFTPAGAPGVKMATDATTAAAAKEALEGAHGNKSRDNTIPAGVTLPQPAGVSAAFSGCLYNPQAVGGYAPPGIPSQSHSSNEQVKNWNPGNSGYPLAPEAYPGQVYSAPVQYTALGGFPTTPAVPPQELRAMQQMPPPHHGGQQFTPAGAPGVKMATDATTAAAAKEALEGAHGDKSRDNTIPAGVTLPQPAGVSAAFSGCLYNPQAVGGYAPPGIPSQSHSSNEQVPNWNPGNSRYPLAPEAYPGQVYSAPVQYTALGGFPTTPAVPPQELRAMQQMPPPHHGGQQFTPAGAPGVKMATDATTAAVAKEALEGHCIYDGAHSDKSRDNTIPAGVTLPQAAGVSAAFSDCLCNPQAAVGYAPPGIPGQSHSSNGQVPNWNPGNSGYPLAPGSYPGKVYSAPVQYTTSGGFPTTPAVPPHELRAWQQMPPPHHGGQHFTPAGAPAVKMATDATKAAVAKEALEGHCIYDGGYLHMVTSAGITQFQMMPPPHHGDGTTAAVAKEALEGHCIYDGGYCKLPLSYSHRTNLNVKAHGDKRRDYTISDGVTLPQPAGVSAAFSGWLCNPQAAGGYAPPGIPGQSHSSNGQVPNWNPDNSGYPLAPKAYPGQVYSAPVQYTASGGFPTTPAGLPHELHASQQMPPPHHGGQQFTPAGAPRVEMATDVRTPTVSKEALEGHCIYDAGYCKLHLSCSHHTDLNVKSHGDKSRDYTIPTGVTQEVPQPAGVSAAFSGRLCNPQAAGGYAPPGIPGQSHSSNGQVPKWNPGNSRYPLAPGAYPGQVYSTLVQYTASGGFPTTSAGPPHELRASQKMPPPHRGEPTVQTSRCAPGVEMATGTHNLQLGGFLAY